MLDSKITNDHEKWTLRKMNTAKRIPAKGKTQIETFPFPSVSASTLHPEQIHSVSQSVDYSVEELWFFSLSVFYLDRNWKELWGYF